MDTKIGSVIHTIIRYYNHCTQRSFFFLHSTAAIHVYILEQLGIVSTAANEPILAPLQSRLSLSTHHVTWNEWTASPANGLAWLFSALLAQILLLIKVPNSSTSKSHRYLSQLKPHKTQYSNYRHTLSCFPYIFILASWKGLLGSNHRVDITIRVEAGGLAQCC